MREEVKIERISRANISRRNESLPLLFAHQQAAFDELLLTARILFSRRWRALPLRPRFNVLLIGQTGLGKTAIVRGVAKALSIPLFEVSASNWMLLGTHHRGATPTWPSLFRFLLTNRLGVIFLDEVDKIAGHTDWSVFLRTEILGLLDRTLPRDIFAGSNDSEEGTADQSHHAARARRLAQLRLQYGMLIAASGAFESLLESASSRRVGFNETVGGSDFFIPDFDALSKSLPRELVNRFRSRLLYLRPLEHKDYMGMLLATVKRLPEELRDQYQRLGQSGITGAVNARLGVRWLEELMIETLAITTSVPAHVPHCGGLKVSSSPLHARRLGEPGV